MKSLTKLDTRLRGIIPPIFSPGDVLERKIAAPDTVLFRLLKPAEAPLVKSRNWRGKIMGVKNRLESSKISDAIRTDREAQ